MDYSCIITEVDVKGIGYHHGRKISKNVSSFHFRVECVGLLFIWNQVSYNYVKSPKCFLPIPDRLTVSETTI